MRNREGGQSDCDADFGGDAVSDPVCTHISCEAMAYQIVIRRLRADFGKLLRAAKQTLAENGHLADGDVCTLIALKRAVEEAEIAE